MLRAVLFVTVLTAPAAAQGTFTNFGQGCPGSAGTPFLSAFGDHQIGGQTIYQVTNLVPNQPAVLLFGASNTIWNGQGLPLDLGGIGMTGCSLLVSPDGIWPSSTMGGVAQEFFNHPLEVTLIGQSLFSQFAALDPNVTAPTKVVVTNGGELVFGAACTPGSPKVTSGTFDLTLPPIPQLNTPQLVVKGSYSGTQQKICCGGPTSPQSGCTFTGSGQMTGSSGSFNFTLPAATVRELSNALCNKVSSVTLGVVTCTMTLGPITVPRMQLSGNIGATKNECQGVCNYTGSANITFPKVRAVATARVKIDLFLTSINFTTGIDLEATPRGSAQIANNNLTANANVPSVRASKTFTIPVLNIPITFSHTENTPQLSGATQPVAIPPLPITCE